jgi:MerR family transcriptional regulator, light-induced transcriptional regulator
VTAPGPYLEELAWGFNSLQLSGDCRRSVDFLLGDGRDEGVQPRDLLAVVTRAQRRIGELWRANRVTVAQEHMASAIAELALAQLYAQLPRAEPTGMRATVACVEGELHSLGARVLADVLDLDGLDVRFLGANVPTAALVDDVFASRPDAVCLSVGSSHAIPSLVRAVRQLREEIGDHLLIAGGGQAFNFAPSLHRNLPLDLHGGDAEAGATAIEQAVGRRALPEWDGGGA